MDPEPQQLAALAERREDDFVAALAEMVNVDCGSFNAAGVNRIADLCEKRFRDAGWEVDRLAHEPAEGESQLGDMVVGQLPGGDGPSLLMIGHMDTVFPDGTAAERPFRIEDGRAHGPGVSDMKGGLLAGFFAMEVLQEAGVRLGTVTYICNPDEEIGSPWSHDFIEQQAGVSDVALVLEGARANGAVVSQRKGVTDFWIDITGRAAHAGVEPEKGRSAVLEAANVIMRLHDLNGRWPGVTVNVGVVEGGTRPNVVAERCRMHVDVRSPEEATLGEVEAALEGIGAETVVPGVEVSVQGRRWHRPMEKTPGTARLAEIATEVAAELGFDLRDVATGGASDANTVSAAGVPVLDGLGLVGGGDHGPAEWVDVGSVVPRVSLLAGLISRVASTDTRGEPWI